MLLFGYNDKLQSFLAGISKERVFGSVYTLLLMRRLSGNALALDFVSEVRDEEKYGEQCASTIRMLGRIPIQMVSNFECYTAELC